MKTANISTVHSSLTKGQIGEKINQLNDTITNIHARLHEAAGVLSDVVTKSTAQTIASRKFFQDVNATYFHANGSLEVYRVNGFDLSQLRDDAVYVDQDTTIDKVHES